MRDIPEHICWNIREMSVESSHEVIAKRYNRIGVTTPIVRKICNYEAPYDHKYRPNRSQLIKHWFERAYSVSRAAYQMATREGGAESGDTASI